MSSWKRYLEKPRKLKLYVIHTGYVHMDGNIHFNKNSSKFKSLPEDKRFNPVYCFLAEHPEKGYVLMDTGLHPSFAAGGSGNFGWMLGMLVKTRAEKGRDVVSQLQSIHVAPENIRKIILSHLHLDHPSALPCFRNNNKLEVFMDEKELAKSQSRLAFLEGYIKGHIEGFKISFYQYNLNIPPFPKVCDLFGDGSIFMISTPGHTPGHVSALLNMSGGPLFLTFDAAHRGSNFTEMVPPKGEFELALNSLENINSFMQEFPNTRIIYGHDPDQLNNLTLLPKYYS